MPKYRLFILFEIKPPDSGPFSESFDKVLYFKDLIAAEKELESITSIMVSGFSDEGYEWTIIEKYIETQKGKQESDLTALML